MAIVEFLDPAYVKLRLDNLDISLSSLRDAIRGADSRTLTDIYNIGTAIRDRLPASLTATGNLKIAILEDTVGIAKDSTLSSILSKLDVNLSTRASESTLVAVRDRLPISLTTSGNFKVAILEDSVGLAKSSDLANLANLDVALSYLWKLLRWGRNVEPSWVHGGEVTAPAAGTALVSKTVSSGKSGYIYGFYISADEGNTFKINWTSGEVAYSTRILFPGPGTLHYIDLIPVNEGLPASGGTTITITNVNAGSTGVVYQAGILYAEV